MKALSDYIQGGAFIGKHSAYNEKDDDGALQQAERIAFSNRERTAWLEQSFGSDDI